MAVPNKRGPLFVAAFALTFSAMALSARADEFKLKGGRKLYGVIVSYEDNMFKIKTDFGYELIEKDKIESIIPSTPAGKSEPASAAKKSATRAPSKTEGGAPTDSQPPTEAANAASSDPAATATNASTKTANASPAGKLKKRRRK